jgi:hypothetical protein
LPHASQGGTPVLHAFVSAVLPGLTVRFIDVFLPREGG